jgi:hypothetical protein
MKLLIKDVHGGDRTYINNVFLIDNFPQNESVIVSESREKNMPRKSSEQSRVQYLPKTTGTFNTETNMFLISDSDFSSKRLQDSSRFNDFQFNRGEVHEREKTIPIEKSQNSKNEKQKELIDPSTFKTKEEDIIQESYDSSLDKRSYNIDKSTKYKTLDDQIHDMQHHLEKITSKDSKKDKFKPYEEDEKSYQSVIIETIESAPLKKQISNLDYYLGENVNSPQNDDKIDKIDKIENKVTTLENEIQGLKSQINRLNQNLESIVDLKNNFSANNMNFILEECRKMITSQTSTFYNSRAPMSFIKPEPASHNNFKKEQLERRITKSIDERFEYLVENLENKIYNSLLKPSLTRLENNLLNNLEEIKTNLKKLEGTRSQKHRKKEINEVVDNLLDRINKKERIIEELQKETKNPKDSFSNLGDL